MRVIVFTKNRRGMAARCLPLLAGSDAVELAGVVFCSGEAPDRKKALKGKLAKAMRIGPLGAANGVRIRPWFKDYSAPDLFEACRETGAPLAETRIVNSERTVELFENAKADLGVCLGSSYIEPRVFNIPRFGMINLHGEILPRFQGAQSIIWPIYEGLGKTGFTIHQMDGRIDTGDILYQEEFDIEFHKTLRDTVIETANKVRAAMPAAILHVCENYEELRRKARPQSGGRRYTTPTFGQFLRMSANNRRMRKAGRPGS